MQNYFSREIEWAVFTESLVIPHQLITLNPSLFEIYKTALPARGLWDYVNCLYLHSQNSLLYVFTNAQNNKILPYYWGCLWQAQ